jgi:predicted dehydrogenase
LKSTNSNNLTQIHPIYIIGAGGIVNTAHLPAYKIAGFDVQGIYDIDQQKSNSTAAAFNIPAVFGSIDELLKNVKENAVFDIAVPASAIIAVLQQLPYNSGVLIQKPMGEDYEAAKKIVSLTQEKGMVAGVNFQLRYAPFIIEARKMIDEGMLGELIDIEINVNVYTPWHLWDFLFTAPRVEILYHSIHYIDLVRTFFGNPSSVFAKTVKHPVMSQLASVKSNIIMDYGDMKRANILTNHCHIYGSEKQQSYIKLEGTNGAIKISIGTLINYPEGTADLFEYVTIENGKPSGWKTKKIEGSWFPHGFIGSMSQIMLAAEGKIVKPDNSVEDSLETMWCVEAGYADK